MRELTYFVACSVDGYIAQSDGSHNGFSSDAKYFACLSADFPEIFPSQFREVMGIHAENKWFDVVLMGRKTYEVGLKDGITNPYSHMKQYVFSCSMLSSPDENVELVRENAVELVTSLKNETGKGIWLCGGADLATTLFAHKLIDQLILKINPFLMGSGIPLFSGVIEQTALEVVNSNIYENGVVLLDYRVK
ncbi:dihydrofolate reductase [Nostoc sp. FACHB-87]|uniref:dihydrofolate reductase family protein n=1 Tax=Nostocaceae TaxID=1162 RepID=UPI001686E2F1|nr:MULTISPECIES: dihydrofolate reductase family protein [Nostocaceae]MBD2457318.1 dihydrofolate reductase [Nostoc sp. FACHB-87]MBD2478387.1 dihydrofolate reductase [Anabaena sp. FACHB-83]